MLKYYLLAIFLSAMFISGCKSTQTAASIANDEEDIIRVCRNQVDAWRAQSYEFEEEVWAQVPYALKMLTSGTRMYGWDEIGKRYRESFGEDGGTRSEPEFTTALSDFYVHVSGKAAWVVFHQNAIFPRQEGDEQQEIYTTLEVRCLEKIDNRWQIVFQLTGPYSEVQE